MSDIAAPIGLDAPAPLEIARAIHLSELIGVEYLTGLALVMARPEGRTAALAALEGERIAMGEDEREREDEDERAVTGYAIMG